jgi:DNA repair protein RadC
MGADTDHRHGHRERLRHRFLRAGREAFEDYELLELLLSYALPRIDTKPVAKRLIARFRSLAGVLDEPAERLVEVEGVGPQAATLLLLARALMVRYYEHGAEELRTISGPAEVAEFVRGEVGAEKRECLMLLCLNGADRLVHHCVVIEGTVDRVPFYPREILKVALLHDATGLLLAHNHPSGDPTPTEQDRQIAGHLEPIAKAFGMRLRDHLIVTPRSAFSLKTGVLL